MTVTGEKDGAPGCPPDEAALGGRSAVDHPAGSRDGFRKRLDQFDGDEKRRASFVPRNKNH